MADLERMMRLGVWFAVGFLLAVAAGMLPAAHAALTPTVGYTMNWGGKAFTGSTPADTCSSVAGYSYAGGSVCQYRSLTVNANSLLSSTSCYVGATVSSGSSCGETGTVTITTANTCPSNSAWNGSACLCNSGFVENSGGCVPSAGCSAGNTLSTVQTVGWTYNGPDRTGPLKWAVPFQLPTTMCINGCTVSYTGSGPNVSWVGGSGKCGLGVNTDPATGLYRAQCSLQGSTTGSTCSTSGTDQGPVAVCPGYTGQINGKNACLDPGSYAPPATAGNGVPTPTTGTGTGSGTGIGGTGSSGDPGSSTNPINVTVGGGIGGATGTGAPGSSGNPIVTKADRTGSDLGNFCADNPTATVCKSSTVSGGDTCGAMPTCTGDAAQCAIVRQTWETRCAVGTAGTSASLGEQLAGGSDTVQHPLSNPSSVNLSTALDTSDALGGNGCISDKSFSLWDGTTFVLPFSNLCPYLQFMGQIVAAFAMLAAARIVMA